LVLRALPADFPVPILVVQHIADGFVGGLADWLNTVSAVHVKVAEEGETIAPGVVYLAPDDRHLAVSERGVTLSEAPPVGGFRPSANVLFASIARVFGTSAVAVMLTGMGDDGVDGLRTMKSAGGTIVVQDEQSSVVFGMPKAAIAEGLADVILPLREMPAKLIGLL
jgi:two-component system chemotaxis response regulator CheB